jgi:hypothetical protein
LIPVISKQKQESSPNPKNIGAVIIQMPGALAQQHSFLFRILKCDLHCCENLEKELNNPAVRRELYFLIDADKTIDTFLFALLHRMVRLLQTNGHSVLHWPWFT